MLKKDIVIGMGEIGLPIFKLLSKKIPTDGFDKVEKLNSNKFSNIKHIEFLHICIPFSKNFEKSVIQLFKKFKTLYFNAMRKTCSIEAGSSKL